MKAIAKGEVVLTLIIVLVLLFSVYFSLTSFTGYVVSGEVNDVANWTSMGLFLFGIFLAYFMFLRRK